MVRSTAVAVAVVAGLLVVGVVAVPISESPAITASGAAEASQADAASVRNHLLDDKPRGRLVTSSRGPAFRVAPGRSGVTRPGKDLIRFKVEVEPGTGVRVDDFSAAVEDILFDHRGWGHTHGRSLQRVSDGPAELRVTLARPGTVDVMCAPLRTISFVSCYAHGRAVINLERWQEGAPDFPTLQQYRTYVVAHEFGHGLGHGHRYCPGSGGAGRLMMQQTYTLHDSCRPERFADPDAARPRSICRIRVVPHEEGIVIEGSITPTPRAVRAQLSLGSGEESRAIGEVRSTPDGRLRVHVGPAELDPGLATTRLSFGGTRDLRGCSATSPLVAG